MIKYSTTAAVTVIMRDNSRKTFKASAEYTITSQTITEEYPQWKRLNITYGRYFESTDVIHPNGNIYTTHAKKTIL